MPTIAKEDGALLAFSADLLAPPKNPNETVYDFLRINAPPSVLGNHVLIGPFIIDTTLAGAS